jgi:acetyltransferase-like isoleucine patch superfamily enzyme
MINKIIKRVKLFCVKIYTPISYLQFLLYGVKAKKGVTVRGVIYIKNEGDIILEDKVRINSAPWANPIGVGSRTYFQVFQTGKIYIGENSGISNSALTSASSITIGKNVMIGSGCKIYDTDFHPIHYADRINGNFNTVTKPIVISDGAFIGGGSYILKDVTIGKEAVIGAGSVVTKSVPDHEMWAGNPAKFIKKIM